MSLDAVLEFNNAEILQGLITLVLLLLMFTAVIFGFRQRGEVLVVPVATVFAFTQLRNSMPGAPAGFGASSDIRKVYTH